MPWCVRRTGRQDESHPVTTSESGHGAPKPSILVVEDEPALATMLRYNLERQGFRVEEAADGQEALLRIAETRSEKFAGTVHGFRCGGTRIKRGKLGWVLRPDVDPTGRTAWESQAEYDEFKERFLKPYIENGWLLWALRELTKMMPPGEVNV